MFGAATGNDFPYITAVTSALATVFAAWMADERHNRKRLEGEVDKAHVEKDHLVQMFIDMQASTVKATTEQSHAITQAGEAVTKAEIAMTKQSEALSSATDEIRSFRILRQSREGK